MSLYQPLSPRGVVKTVGVCDRCHFRYNLYELRPDGDEPALLVCPECSDQGDPYKLPARKAEVIAVRRPRPEEPLVLSEEASTEEELEPPSLVMNFITDFYSVKVD